MAKFQPWFQKIALPCVAAAFHIYCGYTVTGLGEYSERRLRNLPEPFRRH